MVSSAQAFCRSRVSSAGAELTWCTRQIPFVISENGNFDDPAASIAAVRESFATWTRPPCTNLRFLDQGTTANFKMGLDNDNLIVWREKNCDQVVPADDTCLKKKGACANEYNCWDHPGEDAVAYTVTTSSTRTGEIFDADIELNGPGLVFSTADPTSPPCPNSPPRPASNCISTDIQNAMTHEIGHFIGLDHSDEYDATMYTRINRIAETTKRDLTDDDIDGLCAIYPVGMAATACVDSGADDPRQRPVSSTMGCQQGAGIPLLAIIAPILLGLALRIKTKRLAGARDRYCARGRAKARWA